MNTKTLLYCAFALLTCVPSLRSEGVPAIRLRGIVSFSTNQLALLEVPANPAWGREIILAKGQRERDVEVLEIDLLSGTVKINNAGEMIRVQLTSDAFPPGPDTPSSGDQRIAPPQGSAILRLQQAGLRHVFALYQMLAQRSLIRPSDLPNYQLDLDLEQTAGAADLAKAIEQALAEKGIVLHPERDKFVIAARKDDPTRVTPQLWELAVKLGGNAGRASAKSAEAPLPARTSAKTSEELLPAGAINFPEVDSNQALAIYQELTGRTLVRAPSLRPFFLVTLQTYTPLTRTEAIYAFIAVLAVNGVSVLPAGEKFLLVFPASETNKAAALLARKMPVHAVSKEESFPPGGSSMPTELRNLMQAYQELCGRPVAIDASLANYPILPIRNQTPLTTTEALYGLDLLLGWHGFTVIEQPEGKGLKLVRVEEGKR